MILLVDKYPEHKNLINFYDECLHAEAIFNLADMYLKEESLRLKNPIDDYLRPILIEAALLNIAKIHDPKKIRNFENSSLEYYVSEYGIEESEQYNSFLSRNKAFIDSVVLSRKKAIAHSDFSYFSSRSVVGGFNDGDEKQYFDDLWLVFKLLYQSADISCLPDRSSFVEADFHTFVETIKSGYESR